MLKSKVEEYLGKHVEVTLFDNFAYRGILKKTAENIDRYGHPKHYFCDGEQDNYIFRCSHIKKIKQL